MARNQTKLLDIDPETGRILEDEETSERENLQADQDKAIDDIISEFEKSDENVIYRASVNKVPDGYKKGGKEEWCFDVDSAEITGMRLRLRDEYGPGIYRVRVYRNSKLIRQFDYHIARPSTVKPMNHDNAAMTAILEELRNQREETRKLTERLLSPNPINQSDDIDRLVKLSTVMKNMQPAQIEHSNNGFGMKEGMELFTRGMELAENMRGDGGDSWISVVKEMVKGLPIQDLLANLAQMKQQQQRPQLPGPQIPNQMQRGPMMPPQQPNNAANNSPANTGAMLEANMKYLIGKAMADANPELYAEWLLDNADINLIRQMANDANVLNQLAMVFPKLNDPAVRQWFGELVENVKTMLADYDQQSNSAAGIGQPQMHGQDAGATVSNQNGAGGYSGNQNDPETHAESGQTGP